MDNPLIGVMLVGETNNKGSHIGLVHLPLDSRDQTLSRFRSLLASSLSQLKALSFIFLTPHGWEINSVMEDKVTIIDIISGEGVINVRISYPKPKFGVKIEGPGEAAVSAGFLFCKPEVTITQLRNEIRDQLPRLYEFLSTIHFAFLDLNDWPINRMQEPKITVLEVACLNVIRIRCSRPLSLHGSSSKPIESSKSGQQKAIAVGVDLDPSSSILEPITEKMEYTDSSLLQSLTAPDFESLHKSSTSGSCEILISYVHNEASQYAISLKTALEGHGYRIFLDVHSIQGGTDWQDVLNDAISTCSLFIPLITTQYGQTLWTNREVKLADVLGKVIIPVNFLHTWPPKCLAIQFATTQFVVGIGQEIGKDEIDHSLVKQVATDISERYSLEKGQSFELKVEEDESESFASSLTRQDTQPVLEDSFSDRNSVGSSSSIYTPTSPLPLRRKKTSMRSYASSLPSTIDASYRETLTRCREGKPLIVICCASEQKEFVQSLVGDFEMKKFEVWCSSDIESNEDEDNARIIFQEKADEAGVVIFVLSEEFAASSFCEQQVYYCEQRKRIIPLIYKPIQMPSWMSMLIGTSTFISCQASTYKSTLFERIDTLFNPEKAEDELKQVLKQKVELANMCSQLSEQLPEGKHVYISGGTQFYSKNGKEICEALGKELAKDDNIVVVTGGFYGVGDTVAKSFHDERIRLNKPHGVCHVVAKRDKQDKSSQARQNEDGTFAKIPFGDTLYFGDSVRIREMLTPRVIDLCILIEGGPGAAFEAQQFSWNGNRVLPVKNTGGAASGLFNVPTTVFDIPPNVKESDWSVLADSNANPREIASALYRIVQAVKSPSLTNRSRCSSLTESRIKKRVSIKRSDTLPLKESTHASES